MDRPIEINIHAKYTNFGKERFAMDSRLDSMPVEQVIWKLGENPERLKDSKLHAESELEGMIYRDVSLLSDQWLLIGRQVRTDFNSIIDFLAIDNSGSLIVIELKKSKTPRDVVAQAIDYASWVKNLNSTDIADIFEEYCQKYLHVKKSLDKAFVERFGVSLAEDELNNAHQIIIVASELDLSSERIVKYLNDSNIPVNVVFFRVFKDADSRYLSRAWFIDPAETQQRAITPKSSEPWNGEYYVSFGDGMGRDWEDARKYGFVSGGGGRWYSQTLNLLKEGDRIWVNIPKAGYVGVGIVESPAVKLDEFLVENDKGMVRLLDAPIHANYLKQWVNDEDRAEYFVKVKWLHTESRKNAVSELGFFGNQNTVCRPTTPKWTHTVDRLRSIFPIKE